MTHPETLDLVGTSDASRILGVHPATVTRMVESDQLTPAGRLGGDTGAFVFNRSDVVALAEKRKAETEEPPTSPTSGASRSVF